MIRIYGLSDDLIEIDSPSGGDEIGCYDTPRTITVTDAIGQGVRVIGEYAPNDKRAVWRFAVEPLDDGVPCPWPIRIEKAHEYSLAVCIDAPESATIEHDAQGSGDNTKNEET